MVRLHRVVEAGRIFNRVRIDPGVGILTVLTPNDRNRNPVAGCDGD